MMEPPGFWRTRQDKLEEGNRRLNSDRAREEPFADATPSFDDRTAEQLAGEAQDGSLEAFAELVDRYQGRLFNFILRRVGNWSDAEELTQEAFVRAWERLERYDDRWRFSTWLFTIGSRLAVSHHRSKKRIFVTDTLEFRAASGDGPAAEAMRREAKSPTWEIAARILSETQHTALWLRYAEGLSIREIACILDKTQVSVRVTLFRARDSLATHILELRKQRDQGQVDSTRPEPLPAVAGWMD